MMLAYSNQEPALIRNSG